MSLSKTGERAWYHETNPTKEPSMSEQHDDNDSLRISSLEEKITDLGEMLHGLQQRLDGLPGESSLEGKVDGLAGALADVAQMQATNRDELSNFLPRIDTLLQSLQVTVALGRRLETYFRPMLDGVNEIKSDEVASKSYVDAACVKVSQVLREHVRRMVAQAVFATDSALAKSVPRPSKAKGKSTAASKRGRLAVSTRRR